MSAELDPLKEVHIMTSRWDTSIKEADLSSLSDEDIAWFRDEVGLSLDDLHGIVAGAKEIARELKPCDELLDLLYEVNDAWYISFARIIKEGRLEVHIRRER